jgi:hypothetical protein
MERSRVSRQMRPISWYFLYTLDIASTKQTLARLKVLSRVAQQARLSLPVLFADVDRV